jgi:hypothetical protein
LYCLAQSVVCSWVEELVDAKDFWVRLEYRVCREIYGLRGDEFGGLWCDGFIPEQFEMVDGRPAMTGLVWMGRGGKHQEAWRFTVLLPEHVIAEADIDWQAIFPVDDLTGWLCLDQKRKVMKVDSSVAYPDRQPGVE